jgi:hypothetical protein
MPEAKLDQADYLAQLTTLKGDPTKLVAGATLPADIVSAANSIFTIAGERDSALNKLTIEQGKVVTLTGEKTQLSADLVTAKASIVSLTAERDTLKAEKTTLDAAVASKLAALGIVDNTKAKSTAAAGEKKPTLTEQVLAAQGCKTLAESEAKFRDAQAKNPGA